MQEADVGLVDPSAAPATVEQTTVLYLQAQHGPKPILPSVLLGRCQRICLGSASSHSSAQSHAEQVAAGYNLINRDTGVLGDVSAAETVLSEGMPGERAAKTSSSTLE